MKSGKPIFNPTTHYQIEVRGQVDVGWLQSFEPSVEIISETMQMEEITLLNMHTDQAGIVGLVRRLHSFGITILKLEVITRKE